MSTKIKLAEHVIDKSMLISLGVDESQIVVSKLPLCKIGENVYAAKVYKFNTIEEFTSTDMFNDLKHAGVFVIYEQNTMVDIGIELSDDSEVPQYILRIFG